MMFERGEGEERERESEWVSELWMHITDPMHPNNLFVPLCSTYITKFTAAITTQATKLTVKTMPQHPQ